SAGSRGCAGTRTDPSWPRTLRAPPPFGDGALNLHDARRLLAGEVLHRLDERLHLGGIARAGRVTLQLGGDQVQHPLPAGARRALGLLEAFAHRRNPGGGESARTLELIHVRAGERERRGPDELPLSLRIPLVEVDAL